MNNRLVDITKEMATCTCGNIHHSIPIEKIIVAHDALEQSVPYMESKGIQNVLIVVDDNTYEAAGSKLCNILDSSQQISYTICKIEADESGTVLANETSIVQVLLNYQHEVDALIAVGSGTIHDITRFCSGKIGKPFISIPTAPSVDGFTSLGAPIIVRGFKQTVQTVAPIALFADINILRKAPTEMIAAGFGDMIAKFTSLADWKFGVLLNDEPYCPLVESLTKEALEKCIANKDSIAMHQEKGIKVLIESLILSGIAMLIFGQSHPASGGEHHLSHYWEMDFLQKKRAQVLHGAKVAVTTAIIAQLYKEEISAVLVNTREIKNNEIRSKVEQNKSEIKSIVNNIPQPAFIEKLIEQVGGETTPYELGIEDELISRSMLEAHQLRERFTMLRFINKELEFV